MEDETLKYIKRIIQRQDEILAGNKWMVREKLMLFNAELKNVVREAAPEE